MPWRIPEFLAQCDVVCCLERKFPVAFHAPRLPREILSSGAVLFCSREIAEKQVFYEIYGRIEKEDINEKSKLSDFVDYVTPSGEKFIALCFGSYDNRPGYKMRIVDQV